MEIAMIEAGLFESLRSWKKPAFTGHHPFKRSSLPRPKATYGGGPIADRGSRRNLRRIEAANFRLPPDKLLKAQQRHAWYWREREWR